MLPELLQGGRYESSGTFTVDLARADEKLGRYQSAEPLFFLLKFVQAAVAAEATSIRIDRTPQGVRLLAAGVVGFPLESYYRVGIRAALAAGARRVLCGVGQELLVAERGGSRVVPFNSEELYVLIEGLHHVPFARLQQRLAYAPLPITLDGQVLNHLSAPTATRRLTRLQDRTQGVACAGPFVRTQQRYEDEPAPRLHEFPLRACTGTFQRGHVPVPVCSAVLELRDPQEPSRVVFVKHGVTLDTVGSLNVPGAHCVVSAEGLDLDLSTLSVVHDAAYEDRLRSLDREVRSFYTEMVHVFGKQTRSTPSWQRILVVLLGLVVFVALLACLIGGEAPGEVSGCDITGGWGSSSPADKLRNQLVEALQKF